MGDTHSRITQTLVQFCRALQFADLPPRAVSACKSSLLDILGTSIGGASTPAARKVAAYVAEEQAIEAATLIGTRRKSSATLAALANGTSAHVLSFDDASWPMMGHPATVLFPSLLALGESEGVAGGEFIVAYVVGYEVANKLGRWMNPHHYGRSWHATCSIGVVAAAAACSRLLGLGENQFQAALGIAASTASGIRRQFGSETKPFHPGHAASNAVRAALMARLDLTAALDVLDGAGGFLDVYSGADSSEVDLAGLGSPLEIVEPGISLKRFPCCTAIHAAIDATLQIVSKESDLAAESIASIRVTAGPVARQALIEGRPRSGLQGKLSMAYCIASAIIDGDVNLASFEDNLVQRADRQALLSKVTLEVQGLPRGASSESDLPTTVQIRLQDGRRLERTVLYASGHSRNPMSSAQIESKFRGCAGGTVSEEVLSSLSEHVAKLESLSAVADLVGLTRPN